MKLSTAKKIARFQMLDEKEIYELMEDICSATQSCVGCPIGDSIANLEDFGFIPKEGNILCSGKGEMITFYLRHGYLKGNNG